MFHIHTPNICTQCVTFPLYFLTKNSANFNPQNQYNYKREILKEGKKYGKSSEKYVGKKFIFFFQTFSQHML
jgi:hypothetical protein